MWLAASGSGEPVLLLTLGDRTFRPALVWDVILCSLQQIATNKICIAVVSHHNLGLPRRMMAAHGH